MSTVGRVVCITLIVIFTVLSTIKACKNSIKTLELPKPPTDMTLISDDVISDDYNDIHVRVLKDSSGCEYVLTSSPNAVAMVKKGCACN